MKILSITNIRAEVALGALILVLVSCSNPSSPSPAVTPVPQDVSTDMATVAADLNLAQNSSLQANFVDESTAASESSSSSATSGNGESRAAVAVSMSVSAEQTVPNGTPTPLQDGDVVTVVRSWTNAEGESVVDTVVRPKIPGHADFVSPSVTSPSFSTAGVSASYSAASGQWSLKGTETKNVNGIAFVQQTFSMVYSYSGNRVSLVSITKAGENLNLFTTDMKLNSTIFYTYDSTSGKDSEYLRVLDFVGTKATLQRQVYAWGITPSVSMGIPALFDSTTAAGTTAASALTFTPALAPESGRTSVSLWYYSKPSSVYGTPSYTGTSMAAYPELDLSHWIGSVLQESGPRIADWYKPVTNSAGSFVGNYIRRNEHTYYTGGSTNKIYSLTDGVTLVNTVGTLVYQTAGNGTVTTTKKFSDGISSTVTITPTDDADGNITGYVITRGGTTYTVVYTKDTTGDPTSIAVTNSTTGKTKVFTNTSGTWS